MDVIPNCKAGALAAIRRQPDSFCRCTARRMDDGSDRRIQPLLPHSAGPAGFLLDGLAAAAGSFLPRQKYAGKRGCTTGGGLETGVWAKGCARVRPDRVFAARRTGSSARGGCADWRPADRPVLRAPAAAASSRPLRPEDGTHWIERELYRQPRAVGSDPGGDDGGNCREPRSCTDRGDSFLRSQLEGGPVAGQLRMDAGRRAGVRAWALRSATDADGALPGRNGSGDNWPACAAARDPRPGGANGGGEDGRPATAGGVGGEAVATLDSGRTPAPSPATEGTAGGRRPEFLRGLGASLG